MYNFQSPYLYASINPIRFIDFKGMHSDDEVKKTEIQIPDLKSVIQSVLSFFGADFQKPSETTTETLEATNKHIEEQAETRENMKAAVDDAKEEVGYIADALEGTGTLMQGVGYAAANRRGFFYLSCCRENCGRYW